jgi:hypothetical protein
MVHVLLESSPMELPIVSTTHVPGREQVVRAWVRALEMVGGATDGLLEREGYQRIFVKEEAGAAWHDAAFGFGRDVTGAGVAEMLKGDACGLPQRAVIQGDVAGALEPLGYARHGLYAAVLNKTRMDWQVRGDLQVLPGRAVYGDVMAFAKRGAALMLDEARLDMLLLRDAHGPVAYGSVITVNTMGLIVDFHVKEGTGEGTAETMLWYLLELCARSQHKSIGVVLEGDAFGGVFESRGFARLNAIEVWDRPQSRRSA